MNFTSVAEINAAYVAAHVDPTIDPNDTMFNTGPTHYFTVGKSAVQMILQGLSIAWTPRVNCILDIPCGHGRVARHLRAAFPQAEIYFCDIDETGADFCAAHFGGTSIHSQPDLTLVSLPKQLDLIWVGSLFTHVDETRTTAWLRHLATLLADHGILVATFHGLFSSDFIQSHPLIAGGVDLKAATEQFHSRGYGYSTYPGQERRNYGLSISHPSKILEICTSIPDTRVVTYTERGWAGNHDVVIISKTDRYRPF